MFLQHRGMHWNCAACTRSTMYWCYFAIGISQLCKKYNNREKTQWERSEIFLNQPQGRFSNNVVKGSNVSQVKHNYSWKMCPSLTSVLSLQGKTNNKLNKFHACFTSVFVKGSAVCRIILKEPTVAPNMWCQNVKQYPFSPAGGSSGNFSWAMFPFRLGGELLM